MFYRKIIGAILLVSSLGGCAITGSTAALNSNAFGADGRLRHEIAASVTAETMPVGQQVVPPIGYIGYCLHNKEACAGGTDEPSKIEMTAARWAELNEVNDYVNRNIPQVEDAALYDRDEWWTVAGQQGGDCEDLALLKQKMLAERGWPVDSLLITVAKQWNGEGHALLVVETTNGDYVLDNKNWAIVSWQDAPYTWIKRQSRERPYIWVNLDRKTFRTQTANALPPVGSVAPFVVAALKMQNRANHAVAELRPTQTSGETSALHD